MKCASCGLEAGDLPTSVDPNKPWLRCPHCGGQLEHGDDDALERFECPACGGPLTESILGCWECRNGCRITPKFILGHHTDKAKRQYMSVSG